MTDNFKKMDRLNFPLSGYFPSHFLVKRLHPVKIGGFNVSCKLNWRLQLKMFHSNPYELEYYKFRFYQLLQEG